MLMGWSSSTPAEAMSGSLVHPSTTPQGKMVLENARRVPVTHPGHLQVLDAAGPLGRLGTPLSVSPSLRRERLARSPLHPHL